MRLSPPALAALAHLRTCNGIVPLRRMHSGTVKGLQRRGLVTLRYPQRNAVLQREVMVVLTVAGREAG